MTPKPMNNGIHRIFTDERPKREKALPHRYRDEPEPAPKRKRLKKDTVSRSLQKKLKRWKNVAQKESNAELANLQNPPVISTSDSNLEEEPSHSSAIAEPVPLTTLPSSSYGPEDVSVLSSPILYLFNYGLEIPNDFTSISINK